MISGAKAQQRRRAVAQVGEHQLALGPVGQGEGGVGVRIHQLGVDDPARSQGAFRPARSHSNPNSETPMSPIPLASVTRAPQPSSSLWRKAELAAAGLSPATQHSLDARARADRCRASAAHSIA